MERFNTHLWLSFLQACIIIDNVEQSNVRANKYISSLTRNSAVPVVYFMVLLSLACTPSFCLLLLIHIMSNTADLINVSIYLVKLIKFTD